MSELVCNNHFIECEDCGACLLLESLEDSLLCRRHCHDILCCKDCLRIIYYFYFIKR